MAAYKIARAKPVCPRCGKAATHEVFNAVNASQGNFCRKHADEEVQRLNFVQQLREQLEGA